MGRTKLKWRVERNRFCTNQNHQKLKSFGIAFLLKLLKEREQERERERDAIAETAHTALTAMRTPVWYAPTSGSRGACTNCRAASAQFNSMENLAQLIARSAAALTGSMLLQYAVCSGCLCSSLSSTSEAEKSHFRFRCTPLFN